MAKAKNEAMQAAAGRMLAENDNFLIVTHENPDGDALGSTFALLTMLHDNGKTAEALLPEVLPDKYREFISCNYRTAITPYELSSYSCVIALDNPNPARLGLGEKLQLKDISVPLWNFDHHPDNKLYCKNNLVLPEMAAAAELLFMLCKTVPRWKISPRAATLLLLGIIMDTGGFRFDNTHASTLRHAAELLELKADHHLIVNEMFFSKPLPQQKFEAELIDKHLKIMCDGLFAWVFVPDELIKRYQIDMRNTEGMIESLRSIRGTEIVAVMQRREDGFKLSLRSKNPKFSVGSIARQLNGGGHELAAGCIINCKTVENAEKILLSHVKKVLNGEA